MAHSQRAIGALEPDCFRYTLKPGEKPVGRRSKLWEHISDQDALKLTFDEIGKISDEMLQATGP